MTSTHNQPGSRAYLFSIVLVAIIGGLLFGYDTAVISGAGRRGCKAFFMGADFAYTDTIHGLTSSSRPDRLHHRQRPFGSARGSLGRKRSLFVAGVLFSSRHWAPTAPNSSSSTTANRASGYSSPSTSTAFWAASAWVWPRPSAPCTSPKSPRATSAARLVSWNQFAIIFGQLVVYSVNFLILALERQSGHRSGGGRQPDHESRVAAAWTIETGWRLMFVSEAVPAVSSPCSCCWCPRRPATSP